jgi:drug/metabolite transporter (DMT)-like permease
VTRRGLLLFAAMSIVWGIPYLLIRVAVMNHPAMLVFARTSTAAAILRRSRPPSTSVRAPPLAVGDRVRGHRDRDPWVLLARGQRIAAARRPARRGVPLVGATIAVIVGGPDRVGRRQAAGLLIGFAGVAAIAGGDFEAESALALVQIAIVVVCYALGPFILSRRLVGVPSLGIMAASLALTALLYLPVALVSWPATPPGQDVLASIVILAVVCTAAAFLVFAALIREVGPVRATVITYVNPVVAAVLGVLILDETLTPPMLVGFALAIAGSTLATRDAPRMRRRPSTWPMGQAAEAAARREGPRITTASAPR